MSSSDRAFAHDKYWLKRARVLEGPADAVPPSSGAAPDGAPLMDIRIENGAIRAVVPAGSAPCCCRGIDLEGGTVRPLAAAGRVVPGAPADLHVTHGRGGSVDLIAGKPDGLCTLCIECVCTPPGDGI